ncbi:MAG: sugar phosphorylase [Anaerolineales bacterium]
MFERRIQDRIQEQLTLIYGPEPARQYWPKFLAVLEKYRQRIPDNMREAPTPSELLTEQDAILITYGDQFHSPDQPPLQTLDSLLHERLGDTLSGVHILPFFPYSSDDGFSVIDYQQVDPNLGDWSDIQRLGSHFRLMFDAVINHISRESDWFQAFKRGEQPYMNYFITVDPQVDLSMVVRPRALPLLSEVHTNWGVQHVWTTFSEDQIDLNYANPQVLLEMVDLLLFYVERGADIIRLDAIAYLWKAPGKASIHEPQVYAIVKIFRAALDAVAPGTLLITETNVPHKENVSYFGSKQPASQMTDMAQMVYQFPLAPLTLHTFLTGNTGILSRWASTLKTPSQAANFFNFIASHDGIGVMPARGLLDPQQIDALVERTRRHGGQVSYKTNQDGSQSVYELNITLYDWLNDPSNPDLEVDVRRFLASQAIMLSLAGVPGIYVHSLFGSRNCQECLQKTGRARSINREKFRLKRLSQALDQSGSREYEVFNGYKRLLNLRRNHPAFHPAGEQRILQIDPCMFALQRVAPDASEHLLILINVTPETITAAIDLQYWNLSQSGRWQDILDTEIYSAPDGSLTIPLDAYEVKWLLPEQ